MEFTPNELKLIEHLRKQERKWPRDRWILLATGVFGIIAYCYFAFRVIHFIEPENYGEGEVLFFAYFWPKCLLMFCIAAYFIGLAIRDWRGNANSKLLLKLLEAQLNQTSKDSKPDCGSKA